MKRCFIFSFTCLGLFFLSSSMMVISKPKKIKVSGVVVDSYGYPMFGTSIYLKNTRTGTITNKKGQYNIECNKNDFITFSFVGCKAQEFKAKKVADTITLICPPISCTYEDIFGKRKTN